MAELLADLRFRGLVNDVTDPRVLPRLDADRLTVYIGFDPSAPSLHVGSLLQLCTLRRFQLAGHRPIALAGGGTGLIGDPGGKAGERALLGEDVIEGYVSGISAQMSRFLDFSESAGDARAVLVDNADWLATAGLLAFLRDVGKHFTVNQMTAKESVRTRLEREGQGISYTEFSYMLLQAYDFLQLHQRYGCQLQIGGSDQWGNITMGVDLIRRVRGEEAFGLTTPLLLKADGTKFGKSESGTIWLDPDRTSPYRFYQFFLQTEDAVVGRHLRFLTFLSHEEILQLEDETAAHPERRSAARALARAVCELVHGPAEAERAEHASRALFEGTVAGLGESALSQVVAEVPSGKEARAALAAGMSLVDVLAATGLAASKGEARRVIAQGGVAVNDRRQSDDGRVLGVDDLLHGRYLVLRRGKSRYHVLEFE